MSLTTEQLALFAKLAKAKGLSKAKHPPVTAVAPLEFPMTDVQRAYWLGRTAGVRLSGVASHGYQEFDCGMLDIERLHSSWDKVIARHDMLRATVTPEGFFKVQQTVPSVPWHVDDYRLLSEIEKKQRLEEKRNLLSHRIPDLTKWPIISLEISIVSENFIRIHLSCDAVIADVYSIGICLKELSFYYRHPDASLPSLGMTFGDYVTEIKNKEKTPFYQKCLTYWHDRLATFPMAPLLPTVEKEPVKQHFRRLQGSLTQEDWASFKTICSRYALTPSVVLYAAFSAVLGYWSGRSNFCLNVTLFNRESENPAIANVVGDFTTTMLTAVRTMRPDEAFVDYVRSLDDEFWRDFEHSSYSGIKFLQDLSEHRKTPILMPVVFTSAIGAGDVGEILDTDNGILGKSSYTITQTPQIWLDHQVIEENNKLIYNWDIVDGIFNEEVLNVMFKTYSEFVKNISSPTTKWETPLTITLPKEQERNRKVPTSTSFDNEHLLHQGFLDHVLTNPDQVAIITPHQSLTFRELFCAASGVAQRLKKVLSKENKNPLVAIGIPKSWEQIAAVLGVILTGSAYVPVDPMWPHARRMAVLNQGIQAVIAEGEATPSDWSNLPLITVEPSDLSNSSAFDAPLSSQHISLDSIAYVIFTSGTTGTPKGVVMTHRAVQNTIHDINTRFNISSQDSVFALSSLSFDLSVYDIFGILGVGGHLVLPNANEVRDPSAWVQCLINHPVTIWNSVPALWQMLIEHGASPKQMPRLALLSGDWIPARLPKQSHIFSKETKLISLGGATEAAIWSIAYEISPTDPPTDWKSIPYGRALTHQSVEVLHDDLTPCPDDVIGELFIGGRGLALGYLGDENLTAQKFIIHPRTGQRLYKTGDLGRWRNNGQIEFLGRRDTQVKIGGFRIELGDVESALSTLPEVSAAVAGVCPMPGGALGLVGYIVPLNPQRPPTAEELRTALRTLLPGYMVPQHYVLLDSLPLSDNGKIDRKRLPPPNFTELNSIERGTELEENIREVIARHIGTASFGLDEKFFDLGVTSLLMVKIHRELNEILPQHIALIQLFEAPSVRALAKLFENKNNDAIDRGRLQAEKRLASRASVRQYRREK